MAKQRTPQQANRTESGSPAVLVLAGAICLAAGLAIGYYFGLQSAPSTTAPAPSGAPVSQTSSPVANPSTFLQDEASLKSLVQANPKDMNALVQLGNLYYDNGRFRDAVDWYGRALEIDPKNPNVRTDRGTSYWNLGQADAAIAEFKKSLESDPGHAQTLYNLGVVYLRGKNDPAQARQAWQTLLDKNPSYPNRAELQQQIAALSSEDQSSPNSTGTSSTKTSSVEDLLQRMKTQR